MSNKIFYTLIFLLHSNINTKAIIAPFLQCTIQDTINVHPSTKKRNHSMGTEVVAHQHMMRTKDRGSKHPHLHWILKWQRIVSFSYFPLMFIFIIQISIEDNCFNNLAAKNNRPLLYRRILLHTFKHVSIIIWYISSEFFDVYIWIHLNNI